jgi:hypothetical protein
MRHVARNGLVNFNSFAWSQSMSEAEIFVSASNFYAFPEGNVVLDLRGCLLRVRIIPRGLLIHLAVNQQIVVTSFLTKPTFRVVL